MLLIIEYVRDDFFGDSLIKFIVLDDVYDRGWIIQKSDGVTIILRAPQTGVDIKPFCGEISIGPRDPWTTTQGPMTGAAKNVLRIDETYI